MHKPWDHAQDIKNMFRDGRVTASGLSEKLEKSLQHASDLEALAIKKGVTIMEPFEGMTGFDGAMMVLGPSREYYESLLPHFRDTPVPKINLGILEPIRKAAEEVINWITDQMHIDLLNNDEDTTSAENNTSTVILFNLDGQKLLFTGDAGKTALLNSIGYVAGIGVSLTDLTLLDVPHHGSKRNLSTRVLTSIKAKTAFVSASKNSPKHPAKKVTNALQKYGTSVIVTRGVFLLHHNQGNIRGWTTAAPREPFHPLVEG